jgi:hypothetical protein
MFQTQKSVQLVFIRLISQYIQITSLHLQGLRNQITTEPGNSSKYKANSIVNS